MFFIGCIILMFMNGENDKCGKISCTTHYKFLLHADKIKRNCTKLRTKSLTELHLRDDPVSEGVRSLKDRSRDGHSRFSLIVSTRA